MNIWLAGDMSAEPHSKQFSGEKVLDTAQLSKLGAQLKKYGLPPEGVQTYLGMFQKFQAGVDQRERGSLGRCCAAP